MATKNSTKSRTPKVIAPEPAPLVWEPVESETIEAFAYVESYHDLLVRFRSGGSYVYKNVDPALVARLRQKHPWHEIGKQVMDHPYERLGAIRTRPLKGRAPKKGGSR